MKRIHGLIAGLGIFCSSASYAAVEHFHLDYTFTAQVPGDSAMHTIPVVVTADFTGEQNGDVITNLSFQNFTYNGNVLHTGRAMAFPGSQNAAPVISFSGYSNDFYVHGAGGPEYPYSGSFFSYTFLDIPVQPPPQIGMEMFVPTIEPLYSYTPEDQEINYSWRVSAVPEPASYGMLLLGAALVGVTARRRKA